MVFCATAPLPGRTASCAASARCAAMLFAPFRGSTTSWQSPPMLIYVIMLQGRCQGSTAPCAASLRGVRSAISIRKHAINIDACCSALQGRCRGRSGSCAASAQFASATAPLRTPASRWGAPLERIFTRQFKKELYPLSIESRTILNMSTCFLLLDHLLHQNTAATPRPAAIAPVLWGSRAAPWSGNPHLTRIQSAGR